MRNLIWRCKLWDQNFVSSDSGNINIKESKKTRFYFFHWVQNQICLISWSTSACSRMLFCIGLKLGSWNFKPIFLRMQFSLVATFFLYFWLSVWVEICILNFLMSFQHLYHLTFGDKCKSIRFPRQELVTWYFGSQMFFPNN